MADRQKFTNNAALTLGLDLSSTATTLTLTTGDGVRCPILGANEFFLLTLIDSAGDYEIVRVTARTTDTCTIVRGREGTVARAFATGDAAELRWTRESIERLAQKNAVETISAIWTFSNPPVVPDATAANHPITKGQTDAAYAAVTHVHTLGAITDVSTNNATEGRLPVWRGGELQFEHFSDRLFDKKWTATGAHTWTVPTGARMALVIVAAAGGGGGGGDFDPAGSYTGGRGGPGGFALGLISLVGLTDVTVTVGAKGTGGLGASNAGGTAEPGTAGGASAFGALLSGSGGGGGDQATKGADGGTGTGGTGANGMLPTAETTWLTSRGNGGNGGLGGAGDGSDGQHGYVGLMVLA